MKRIVFVVLVIFVFCFPVTGGDANENGGFFVTQEAKIVFIEDGNTVFVRFYCDRCMKAAYRVNLMAVDAPYQRGFSYTCGREESARFLQSLALGKMVTVKWDSRDKISRRSGALIAYLETGGVDINAEMVRNGFAWVPKKFSADRKDYYLALETTAKREKRGLWGLCPQTMGTKIK